MESIRPTFLTILCILTFIGSGWGLFNGYTTYAKADTIAGATAEELERVTDQLGNLEEEAGSTDFINKMMNSVQETLSPEKLKSMGLASAIGSIIILIGAVLMWGLQKKGYYLYILGTAVAIIAPIVVYGGGFAGLAAAGGALFIGIIFIVLYGIHLKYMH